MSTQARISRPLVTFPDQQTILNYINGHPLKENGIDTEVMAPTCKDSATKVAHYFANKQMDREKIPQKIKKALEKDDPDTQKLADFQSGLKTLVTKYPEPDEFGKTMQEILTRSQQTTLGMRLAMQIYNTVLIDLLEGAILTPPKEGETTWTRHVPHKT